MNRGADARGADASDRERPLSGPAAGVLPPPGSRGPFAGLIKLPCYLLC